MSQVADRWQGPGRGPPPRAAVRFSCVYPLVGFSNFPPSPVLSQRPLELGPGVPCWSTGGTHWHLNPGCGLGGLSLPPSLRAVS